MSEETIFRPVFRVRHSRKITTKTMVCMCPVCNNKWCGGGVCRFERLSNTNAAATAHRARDPGLSVCRAENTADMQCVVPHARSAFPPFPVVIPHKNILFPIAAALLVVYHAFLFFSYVASRLSYASRNPLRPIINKHIL